ncbi:MAG: hypothetical protein WC522_06260 [Candidatus Omnitrophota bacterium]
MIKKERLCEKINILSRDKDLMKLLKIAISIYPEYRSKKGRRTFWGEKILNVATRLKKRGFRVKEYSTLLKAGGFIYYLFEGALKFEKK